MKNEKWLPGVGKEFEWRYHDNDKWKKATCIVLTGRTIGYEGSEGYLQGISKTSEYRPIPTKADVERQELLLILDSLVTDEEAVDAIQMVGFTIPNKVKRSDIDYAIREKYGVTAVVDAICDLLGDLVEQEE